MRLIAFLLCALITLSASEPQTIKLLLQQDVDGALVEVRSGYKVYDPATGKCLTTAYTSSEFFMHPTAEGVKWGAEFPDVFQLQVVSNCGKIFIAGIEYPGSLYAYQIDGAMAFVSEQQVDDFVAAQLSTHVAAAVTDEEAIAALAIAARSDACYKATHSKSKYFDCKAPVCGYQGCAFLRQDTAFRSALKATQGMVLVQQGQCPACAWSDTARMAQVQRLASEGLDARDILAEVCPNATLMLMRRDG